MQGEIFYRLEGVDEGEDEPTDTPVGDLSRLLSGGCLPSEFSGPAIPTQVFEDFVAIHVMATKPAYGDGPFMSNNLVK